MSHTRTDCDNRQKIHKVSAHTLIPSRTITCWESAEMGRWQLWEKSLTCQDILEIKKISEFTSIIN